MSRSARALIFDLDGTLVDTVYAHVSYQSLGVSFRVGPIAQVVRHAQNGYFERPIAYCARHWPGMNATASAMPTSTARPTQQYGRSAAARESSDSVAPTLAKRNRTSIS